MVENHQYLKWDSLWGVISSAATIEKSNTQILVSCNHLSSSALDSGLYRFQTTRFPIENSFSALELYKAKVVLLPLWLQLSNILCNDV